MDDRYGTDVLAAGWRERGQKKTSRVPAEAGLVVEVAEDGYCGAVVSTRAGMVELEDRAGRVRVFPLGPGFMIDGEIVELVAGTTQAVRQPRARTASGSFKTEQSRARVARASRILVEGRHDAELVEKVWGDDLREEGVVVEYLEGVDHLDRMLDDDPPSAQRRYGILVDHLVAGSKEARLAEAVRAGRHGRFVYIVGHPYIDVWQCVLPSSVGIPAWPEVPRGTDWKTGVCRALGWPSETTADKARVWQHILSRVKTYRDIDPALLGRVEELIDFVTA